MPDVDLRAQRRTRLAEVCARFDVEILYAFGSRSQEVYAWLQGRLDELPDSRSDVNLGAKFHPAVNADLDHQIRLQAELQDLLDAPRMDLVSLNRCNPQMGGEIIRGERLYASDEDLADEYDLYVLRREADCLPLENERFALIMGKPR